MKPARTKRGSHGGLGHRSSNHRINERLLCSQGRQIHFTRATFSGRAVSDTGETRLGSAVLVAALGQDVQGSDRQRCQICCPPTLRRQDLMPLKGFCDSELCLRPSAPCTESRWGLLRSTSPTLEGDFLIYQDNGQILPENQTPKTPRED